MCYFVSEPWELTPTGLEKIWVVLLKKENYLYGTDTDQGKNYTHTSVALKYGSKKFWDDRPACRHYLLLSKPDDLPLALWATWNTLPSGQVMQEEDAYMIIRVQRILIETPLWLSLFCGFMYTRRWFLIGEKIMLLVWERRCILVWPLQKGRTGTYTSLDPCSEKAFGCDPYPDFTAVALL